MISLGGTFSIPLGVGEEFDFTPRKASALRRASTSPLREYIADDQNSLLRSLLPSLERGPDLMSPLVLWGPTSTGKSALALALVQRWKEIAPESKVLLLTAADFARAYAHAIETDGLAEFRERFQQSQFVVLDDLQHLAHKASAQAELRTLLDMLHRQQIRSVMTCHVAPTELPFAADLRGRLSQGLVIPVRWPGEAARCEIIRRYLAAHAVQLSADTVERIAKAYNGTPARLFATLAGWLHSAEVERRPLDDAFVAEALEEAQGTPVAPRAIIASVAKQFSITVKDLKGPSRRQAINTARGVAMHLLRTQTRQTFEQIGQQFGGRDHTTVMHACQKTSERLANDPQLQHAVEHIVASLQEAR